MISRSFFFVFLIMFLVFTVVNYQIHSTVTPQPNADDLAIHQDSGRYAVVLHKIKSDQCSGIPDGKDNTFFTCKDGSSVSVIHWKRLDRTGYVTRDYDKDGKLLSIYGHPDDE